MLTEKGLDLSDALLVLGEWGRRWADEGKRFTVSFVHEPCGDLVDPRLHYATCGEAVTQGTTAPRIGENARQVEAPIAFHSASAGEPGSGSDTPLSMVYDASMSNTDALMISTPTSA